MTDQIANFFVEHLGGKLTGEVIAFIVSLLPISELRGGMIVAKIMEVPFLRAFIICFIGNMLPVPFILLFIRRIFTLFGLFLLVAIPLPGTGAWTGALVAALLDIRMKHSLPIIALGVLAAGGIMSALTYGLFGL